MTSECVAKGKEADTLTKGIVAGEGENVVQGKVDALSCAQSPQLRLCLGKRKRLVMPIQWPIDPVFRFITSLNMTGKF